MTPFSESPQATASQMISTIDNAENTERTSSTSPTDLSNDAMSSVEDTWLKVGSHSQLTTSATYPRLGDANTTWMWGDGDIAVNNTMLGDPGESGKSIKGIIIFIGPVIKVLKFQTDETIYFVIREYVIPIADISDLPSKHFLPGDSIPFAIKFSRV